MTDRYFADCCYGTDHQHAQWEPCPSIVEALRWCVENDGECLGDHPDKLSRARQALARPAASPPASDEVVAAVMPIVRAAYACGYTDRPGDYDWSDREQLLFAKVRAAISAMPDQGVGEYGWRPISEAPKDGTELLGWRKDAGTLLIRWTAPAYFLNDRELETLSEESAITEGWFFADFVQGDRLQDGGETPTHFRPLPPPPESNEA